MVDVSETPSFRAFTTDELAYLREKNISDEQIAKWGEFLLSGQTTMTGIKEFLENTYNRLLELGFDADQITRLSVILLGGTFNMEDILFFLNEQNMTVEEIARINPVVNDVQH